MADARADIIIDVDTSVGIAEIKNLQRQIAQLNAQLLQSGAQQARAAQNVQRNLINNINATGQFSARVKTITSTTESFTRALETNKMSMGQYFKYAGGASKTFGKLFKSEFDTIQKVAESRVKTLQTQFVKLGRDANGALKGIAVRPLALDMENLSTKTAIAAQKQQLFNQLIKQGSTNLLNFGKNTQWAGRQLMVGFSVPLAYLGTIASKTFMKMEEQAIRFKRVYGDSFTASSETDKMIQQVQDLAKEFTKYGVQVEKTMAMAADAAAMGKMGADLLAQINQATRLAVLGGVEQEQALETTISLTNAFGTAAEELAGKINFLNAVENQTVTAIEDLTIAIPKAAPVVKQLGGNVEDLAFFLTAMKEGGINASEGANALKSGLASLINPTAKASEFLQGFGINIKAIVEANKGDVKGLVVDFATALDQLDPLNRARAIEQLFGKFQFSRLSTLFQNVIKEGSQAERVLKLSRSTAEELAILSERELKRVEDSPMYKFKKAVEDLKVSLVPLGEAFLKAITPLVEFAKGFLDKFNEMGDGAKNFAVIATTVVAGIGPVLLMTFGLIANGVANLIKMFSFIGRTMSGAGKSSMDLGAQTEYMTQQQLEAAAVASSLDQKHAKLIQTFSVEAGAVNNLATAYARAVVNQSKLLGINPETGAIVPKGAKTPRPRGYNSGVLSVPGPKGAGDIVPAMLSPGEAVIPAKQSQKYAGLLQAVMTDSVPGFSIGRNPFARMASAIKPQGTKYSIFEGLVRMMTGNRTGAFGSGFSQKYQEQEALRFIRSNPRVAVRMKSDDFMSLVNSKDKRYKSVFETGKSYAGDTPEKRAIAEKALLGLKENADPASRPVYGYLFNQERGLSILSKKGKDGKWLPNSFRERMFERLTGNKVGLAQSKLSERNYIQGTTGSLMNPKTFMYGDVAMELNKRAIRNRTTYTYGDSYNNFGGRFATPAPLGSKSRKKFMGAMTSKDKNFFEAQILGGFTLKDVKRIIVTEPHKIPQLQAALSAAGFNIPVGMPRLTMMQKLQKIVYGARAQESRLPFVAKYGPKAGSYTNPPIDIGGRKMWLSGGATGKDTIEFAGKQFAIRPNSDKNALYATIKMLQENGIKDERIITRLEGLSNRKISELSSTKLRKNFGLRASGTQAAARGAGKSSSTTKITKLKNRFAPQFDNEIKDIQAYAKSIGIKESKIKDYSTLDASHLSYQVGPDGKKIWDPKNLIADLGYVNKYISNLGKSKTDINKLMSMSKDDLDKLGINKKMLKDLLDGKHPVTAKEAENLKAIANWRKQFSSTAAGREDSKVASYGLDKRLSSGFYDKPLKTLAGTTVGATTNAKKPAASKATAKKPSSKLAKQTTASAMQAKANAPARIKMSNILRNGLGAFAGLGFAASILPSLMQNQYATGVVSVPGPKGAGDVVPAMLSPGEAVIPAKESKKYAPLISSMINDSVPGYFKGRVGAASGTGGVGFSDRAAEIIGKGLGQVLGRSRILASSIGTAVSNGIQNSPALNKAASWLNGGTATVVSPNGKEYNNGAEVRTDKRGNQYYVDPGKGRISKAEFEARQQQAAAAGPKPKLGARLAGGFGAVGMAASTAGMGMMMSGDPKMQQTGGMVMMAGMLLPMLPMLMNPVGGVIAALAAAVGGFVLVKNALDNATRSGHTAAKAMAMTNDKLEAMSEVTGTVSASVLADRKRQNQLTGESAKKRYFGQNYLESEAGKSLLSDAEDMQKQGMSSVEIGKNFANQLSYAVMQGVVTEEQARSIASALGEKLQDYTISATIGGTLQTLLGPDGQNILKDPLKITMEIQKDSVEQQVNAFNNAMATSSKNAEDDLGNVATGIIASGLAVAGTITAVTAGLGAPVGALIAAGTALTAGFFATTKWMDEIGDQEENNKARGVAVQLGSEQLAQNQGLLDSIQRNYDTQIAELEVKKDSAKTDKERLAIEEQINDKIKERDSALTKQKESNAAVFDSLLKQAEAMGDGFTDSVGLAIDDKFKDATGAVKAAAELAKTSLAELPTFQDGEFNQFKATLQLGLASGEFDPVTVSNLINANKETGGKIETEFEALITTRGTADANQIVQLLLKGSVPPVEIPVIMDYMNTSKNFESDMEALAQLTNMETEYGIKIVPTVEDIERVGEFIEETSNLDTGKPLTKKVVLDYIKTGKDANGNDLSPESVKDLQQMIDNWDTLTNGTNQLDYSVVVDFVVGEASDAAIQAWYLLNNPEEYAKMLGNADGKVEMNTPGQVGPNYKPGDLSGIDETERATMRATFLAQGNNNNNDDGDGDPDPEDKGGDTKDPYKDYLYKLRQLRNSAVTISDEILKNKEKFEKLLKDGSATTTRFLGTNQKLLGAGYSKEFIETINSMDEETRKSFVSIKNGIVTVTAEGKKLKKALSEIALGDFQFSLVSGIAAINSQKSAMVALTKEGMSSADAFEVVQDESLAYAIATAATTEEVRQLVEESKKLKKAQQELAFTTPQGTQAWLDEYSGKVSEVASRVRQWFDAQRAIVDQDFAAGENKSGRNKDLINIEKISDALETAQNTMFDYQYEMDDLQYSLSTIEDKEDEINKKYDERAEALNKIWEANSDIAEQQKAQLNIAQALASGDISAAARAMQEEQRRRAQKAKEDQEKALDLARTKELEALKSSDNKTRKQLEAEILELSKKMTTLEEEKIEPNERLLKLAEDQKKIALEAVGEKGYLGQTEAAWQRIESAARLATVQSDAFRKSLQALALAVPGFSIDKDGNLVFDDKKFAADIPQPGIIAPESQTAPADTSAPESKPEDEPKDDKPQLNTKDSSYAVVANAVNGLYENLPAEISKDARVISKDTATNAFNAARTGGLDVKGTNITIQAENRTDFAKQVMDIVLQNRALANDPTATAEQVAAAKKENIALMTASGLKFAKGGLVPSYFGAGGFAKGTDRVPAMLTPGEFVMKRYAVNKYGTDTMKAINSGTFSGDSVYNYEVNVNVKSDANPDQIASAVMSRINQIDSQRIRSNRY
jgi:TP901 family phage tail tape measure protein